MKYAVIALVIGCVIAVFHDDNKAMTACQAYSTYETCFSALNR